MIPREVFAETVGQFFEPIRSLFDDPTVADIMINGPDHVYVERRGTLELTGLRFASREALEAALRNAAQFVGKTIDPERPILEGRLPDGSRIEAVLPPAAPEGPTVSIRRFFKETLTVEKLIRFGAMTEEVAEALQAIVGSKLNVVIAGGTGSGKTSMLNALSSFIPEGERVVTIEDARELQLQREHVVPLEARPADAKGKGAVTIRNLFRATLRLRPDRIVVGEIRGGEALDMIQAMTSGHGGCMATLHATYPSDTLSRLETMAMMSDVEMPLAAMRVQLASAIDFIVQTARLQDGSRKITHVTEVCGFDLAAGEYVTRDIFLLQYDAPGPNGEVVAELRPTGVLPRSLPAIRAHGYELPASVHIAALAEAG
ncbi:MAG TPA: CpaF family protein [Polyangiaceae bacterium]|jgi:pilus assembly protein CpaF